MVKLDVVAVDRRDLLEHPDRTVRGVDLEDPIPPGAMKDCLHRPFHTELPDPLVSQVAERQVGLELLGRDRPHVANDMGGVRRVRIHPPPFVDDLDAGKVLDPFEDGDGCLLVDILLDRHRKERRVVAGLVPVLHLLQRNPNPSLESGEQLRARRTSLHRAPIDRDGEDPLVVSEDPTLDIEDAASLGRQLHHACLGAVHPLLQLLSPNGLEVPETHTKQRHEDHADRCEHSESHRATISGHPNSVPCSTPRSPSRGTEVSTQYSGQTSARISGGNFISER